MPKDICPDHGVDHSLEEAFTIVEEFKLAGKEPSATAFVLTLALGSLFLQSQEGESGQWQVLFDTMKQVMTEQRDVIEEIIQRLEGIEHESQRPS